MSSGRFKGNSSSTRKAIHLPLPRPSLSHLVPFSFPLFPFFSYLILSPLILTFFLPFLSFPWSIHMSWVQFGKQFLSEKHILWNRHSFEIISTLCKSPSVAAAYNFPCLGCFVCFCFWFWFCFFVFVCKQIPKTYGANCYNNCPWLLVEDNKHYETKSTDLT